MKKFLMTGLIALALAFMTVACNDAKVEEPDTTVADTEMVEVDSNAVEEVVDSVDTLQL